MLSLIQKTEMKVELDSVVFSSYAFYSGILIVKMLIMSALTSRLRLTRRVRLISFQQNAY